VNIFFRDKLPADEQAEDAAKDEVKAEVKRI
jgi:hypothetical protein